VIKPEDKKKNIAVSQIRDLREEAFIKPNKAQKRVFVIDFAETMNPQSQNALLKVLEEPPKTVMFILIVSNASTLLDTIISRCVVLSLVSPEFSVGLEYIKSVSKKEESEIQTALKNSQNNIGKALKLLKGRKGSEAEVAAKEFLDAMLKADSFTMLSVLAKFEKNRVLADNFIKDLKYVIMQKIKNDINSVYTKPLMTFYGLLTEYEQSLATNINLNLLFCSMTSKATELFGG
jgi:DNA polymerase-3 subunit delta'